MGQETRGARSGEGLQLPPLFSELKESDAAAVLVVEQQDDAGS